MIERFVDLFEDCTKQGTKIKTDEYKEAGKYIIVDQGQNDIAGYTDEISGVYEDIPAIVFGDHTRVIKYIDKPFFLGADGAKLLKCKRKNANYKYLYYALKNAKIPNTGYNRHYKWLKEIKIMYPDPIRQQRIVDVLDKIEKIVLYRKKQIDILDDLIKARFVEMFGDPILNDRQFETITGKDFFKLTNGKAVLEEKRTTEGIPAYGGNGISWYTDEILCEEDTLVVGRVGFQSGNVHLAKGPLWVTDNAMYISEFYVGDCNLVFLCALMDHINFTRYQDAGDLKKITQKPFMQMEFIFPPVKMQEQYSTFVYNIDKSKAAVQKSLDETQVLFDSLMQQYFG